MTTKPQLIIVNEFHPETIACLDKNYNTLHLWKYSDTEKRELVGQLEGQCRAVATGSWFCDPIVYELDSLEIISCFGVGVDGIDFKRTKANKIKVTNTPNVLNDAVADLALALILNSCRNLINADSYVREEEWGKHPFPVGRSLTGKTLGIIGLGRIGEEIANRAQSFKLNIAYHNRVKKELPFRYYSQLLELAKVSDILLCVLPGGEHTHKIISDSVFKAMKADSIFINVGRGSCVDESALISALKNGGIAYAGLDVYENEPHVPQQLRDLENTVLLPHIGSATTETRRDMGELLMKNLSAHFDNKALISEVE